MNICLPAKVINKCDELCQNSARTLHEKQHDKDKDKDKIIRNNETDLQS
jgi:hypothetical protein